MKINEKISQLKTIILDIRNISEKIDNNNVFKTKIEELDNKILRLEKGISESVEELEKFLGEENAKP
ncbi:hypothetical protein PQZ42_04530 [Alphaproteobacteria bacterium]|nr:hypothetical protein [Alphaproteobacteria bacterium]